MYSKHEQVSWGVGMGFPTGGEIQNNDNESNKKKEKKKKSSRTE